MGLSMNVLGVTLARGGSKSVPRKNILPILGKPLIVYTIEEAKKSHMIDRYIVSSEDTEIIKIASRAGAQVMLRDKALAQDDTPHIDALQNALSVTESAFGEEYDIVVDLRCTNPLKTAQDIDGAIKMLLSGNFDCVAGVSLSQHPCRIKTIEDERLIDVWEEPLSGRRQDCKPDTYIRNGSIYVVWAEALRQGRFFVGAYVGAWIMPRMRSINIDDWVDFWTVAAIMENMG